MTGSGSGSPLSSSASGNFWTDEDGTLHEIYQTLVYVKAEYLGESTIDPGACPELGWRRHGVAYFCDTCGEIWGRVVFVDSSGRQAPFTVARVSCERHYDQWEVAGSLLGGGLDGLLPYLPTAAVKREFQIHLNRLENRR
jgi:hypothetical protein